MLNIHICMHYFTVRDRYGLPKGWPHHKFLDLVNTRGHLGIYHPLVSICSHLQSLLANV